MSTTPQDDLETLRGSFDHYVSLVAQAGSPTLSSQKEPQAYEEARKIYEKTGKLDAALERVALPIVPGGYQRRELFQPVFQLAILSFLITMFLVFACTTWVPSIESYYHETHQPRPAMVEWLLWFLNTASHYVFIVELAFLLSLASLAFQSRLKIPFWMPGRKRYQQACDRFHQARWMRRIKPDESWSVAQKISQSQAVSIASAWRQSLPLFLSIVVGGALVLGYSLALFVPLTQLIKDLSLPSVMDGRPW